MKRHEFWRQQYRADRYMETLSVEDFVERGKDIMANFLTLEENLKIGVLQIDKAGEYWIKTWTHIMEECVLRKYVHPYPFGNQLNDLQVPKHDWPGIGKAITAFKELNIKDGSFLAKYSKNDYLLETLKEGKICINPASSFSDPSLNRAVRDFELELKFYNKRKAKEETLSNNSSDLESQIKSIGDDGHTIKSNTDYFVYCLSSCWAPRLFGDFEANSCLIIKQPESFVRRLMQALTAKFPTWHGIGTNVKYIDPLRSSKEGVNIFYSKQFRFAYQKEYRVAWYPKDPKEKLDHFFVSLGNLEDICELINLEN